MNADQIRQRTTEAKERIAAQEAADAQARQERENAEFLKLVLEYADELTGEGFLVKTKINNDWPAGITLTVSWGDA